MHGPAPAPGFHPRAGTGRPAAAYLTSVMVLLSAVSLSRYFVAAGRPEEQAYAVTARALLDAYAWLGNVGLVSAFTVGALLYYLGFYRARLVPRWLSVWGIVGVLLLMVVVGLLVSGVIAPLLVRGFAPPAGTAAAASM